MLHDGTGGKAVPDKMFVMDVRCYDRDCRSPIHTGGFTLSGYTRFYTTEDLNVG